MKHGDSSTNDYSKELQDQPSHLLRVTIEVLVGGPTYVISYSGA